MSAWEEVKHPSVVLVSESEGYDYKKPTKRWYDKRARESSVPADAEFTYRLAKADQHGDPLFEMLVLSKAEAAATNIPSQADFAARTPDQNWNGVEVGVPVRDLQPGERLVFGGFMGLVPRIIGSPLLTVEERLAALESRVAHLEARLRD